MTPLQTEVMKALAAKATGTMDCKPIGMARRKEIADAAEALAREAHRLLTGLTYSAYAVASGHDVEVRGTAKGPGVKKTVIYSKWDSAVQGKRMQAADVVSHCVFLRWTGTLEPPKDSKDPLYGEAAWRRAAVDCVKAHLMRSYGQVVQSTLNSLVPDSASLQRARAQQHANIQRSQRASRRHALVRLSDQMRGFDYSREEVLQAWEMAQVEKVMES